MKLKFVYTLAVIMLLNISMCNTIKGEDIDFYAIFEHLNPANIPTGILFDKVYSASDVLLYNGTNSAYVLTKPEWSLIYKELLMGYVTTPAIPALVEIYDDVYDFYREQQIPICIVNVNYNRLKQNVIDDNLLTLTNHQLYDVANPPESPYQTARYFGAMDLPIAFNNDIVKFKFDPSLYISNTGETVQSIDMDFGNGHTYTGLNLNSLVSINYSYLGSTVELTLHLQGGTNLVCTFELIPAELKSATIEPNEPDHTIVIEDAMFNNKGYGANCGVWFGCETGSISQIKKPFIVLEGWDPNNKRTLSAAYGEINVDNFNTTLKNLGYDLIIVDYIAGGAEIQGNAMVLVNLIDTLRTIMEANDHYNDFAIMGVSMGGLVARYALAYMEYNNIPHHTRLFLSMDSPQQGAYVSYASQYLVNLAATIAVFSSPFIEGIEEQLLENESTLLKLFCPASKQMLVYSPSLIFGDHTPVPSPLRTQFLSELSAFGNNGYPTNVDKMVAFSFGSGDGDVDKQFDTAGDIRYQYNGTISGIDKIDHLEITQRAIPDGGSAKILKITTGKTVVESNWWLSWLFGLEDDDMIITNVVDLDVSGTLPYENAPGSFQSITAEVAHELKDYFKINIDSVYSNDCFIPTTSALNLLGVPLNYNIHQNLTNGSYYYEVNNPTVTPFDAIYVEKINKIHEHAGVTDSMMTQALLLIAPASLELENISLNNKKTEYEAENNISLENVTVQNNSILKLRAGQTITLSSNVTINAGCRFEAVTQAYCQ